MPLSYGIASSVGALPYWAGETFPPGVFWHAGPVGTTAARRGGSSPAMPTPEESSRTTSITTAASPGAPNAVDLCMARQSF